MFERASSCAARNTRHFRRGGSYIMRSRYQMQEILDRKNGDADAGEDAVDSLDCEGRIRAGLRSVVQRAGCHEGSAEHYRAWVENEHVRAVENTLAPGERDGMHTHPSGWYYVTKPGTMKVVFADGKVEMWEAKEGEAGWLEAEGAHTSENMGKTTMGFILVEVRSAPKAAK